MKKTRCRIISVIIMSIMLICVMSPVSPGMSDAAGKKFFCLPDRHGGFYMSADENGFPKIIRINRSGACKKTKLNSIDYSFAAVGKDMLWFITCFPDHAYVSNENNQFTPLKYTILDGVSVSSEAPVFDNDDNIYLVDKNKPSYIQKYNKYGILLQQIKCPSKPDRLFFNDSDGVVYALCSGRAFDTVSGKLLPGKADITVSEPVAGRCSDNDGNVYSFSSDDGYEKLYASPYSNACVSKSAVYSFRGNTVYMLGENGETVSSADTGIKIDSLISSGDTIAVLSNYELTILDRDQFVPVRKEDERSEYSRPQGSSKQPLTSDTSETDAASYTPETESGSIDTQSSVQKISPDKETLLISGGYIYIDRPMTLAGLKKELLYGNDISYARNHNSVKVKSGNVGTGWTFSYPGHGMLTVILYGDLTGEGSINSNDVKVLSSFLIKGSVLSDNARLASDIDRNGSIDLRDLYSVYRSFYR